MSEQPSDSRTCGRPTRSGRPCRVQISKFDLACGTHAGEQDRALAEAHRRGYREGLRDGRTRAEEGGKYTIQRLENQVQTLQERLDAATRVYEIDGDQVVEVGRYAYRWHGDPPLEVGERVLLPENWLSGIKHGPGPHEAVVTGLGTTYRGELSRIVGRALGRET